MTLVTSFLWSNSIFVCQLVVSLIPKLWALKPAKKYGETSVLKFSRFHFWFPIHPLWFLMAICFVSSSLKSRFVMSWRRVDVFIKNNVLDKTNSKWINHHQYHYRYHYQVTHQASIEISISPWKSLICWRFQGV